MLNKPLLMTNSPISVEFDVSEMQGKGKTLFTIPSGTSLSDNGYAFPDYDFVSADYTTSGAWFMADGRQVYTDTELTESCVLYAQKREAFPASGSVTITVTPGNYEDTSSSNWHYKYRGYNSGSRSFGSVKTSGSVSFTPERVYFEVTKWLKVNDRTEGSISIDLGLGYVNRNKYFKHRTKITMSPTPRVSALNASMKDSEVNKVVNKFTGVWHSSIGDMTTYSIPCDYSYYSLDSWTYTLTWEPVV